MNDTKQRLLWESARHWLENWADPDNARIFSADCPLCTVFDNDGCAYPCRGCPISETALLSGCKGTPWFRVFQACFSYDTEDARRYMEEEYRFIVCLALGDQEEAARIAARSPGSPLSPLVKDEL